MIEIKFTKEQYEGLIKMVYLGNWMINAARCQDEKIEKYDDIEQYVFSFFKTADAEKYIEFDEKSNQFYPTSQLEEESDIEEYKRDYEEDVFWEGLIDRLARRDFIRAYGEGSIKQMDWKERLQKEDPFIEKYTDEFNKNGLEYIEIKERLTKVK